MTLIKLILNINNMKNYNSHGYDDKGNKSYL